MVWRNWLNARLVKKDPFENVKRGPVLFRCIRQKILRELTGHIEWLVEHSLSTQPWRKGSVFEVLMLIRAFDSISVMSSNSRVAVGSNLCIVGDRYSDERKNPKKAVVQAVQSICRS